MPPLDGNPATYLRKDNGQENKEPLSPPPLVAPKKNYIVVTHPPHHQTQDTVTFNGGVGGSIDVTSRATHEVTSIRKILSTIENADIEKNKYILAKYFTEHKEDYLQLLDYSKRSYGKPFDLTISPGESLTRAQGGGRSLITSLTSYIFKRPKQDVLQPVVTSTSPINPDTLARYASIIAHFLQSKPAIVGEIEHLEHIIIGRPIRSDIREDVRYGEGQNTMRRSSDEMGVAV